MLARCTLSVDTHDGSDLLSNPKLLGKEQTILIGGGGILVNFRLFTIQWGFECQSCSVLKCLGSHFEFYHSLIALEYDSYSSVTWK